MLGQARTKFIAAALLMLVGLVYIKRYSRTINVVRANSCPTHSSWTVIYQKV